MAASPAGVAAGGGGSDMGVTKISLNPGTAKIRAPNNRGCPSPPPNSLLGSALPHPAQLAGPGQPSPVPPRHSLPLRPLSPWSYEFAFVHRPQSPDPGQSPVFFLINLHLPILLTVTLDHKRAPHAGHREARTHHLHLPDTQRGTNPSLTSAGHSEKHEPITYDCHTLREARTHHLHLPDTQRGTNPSPTSAGHPGTNPSPTAAIHSERHEPITYICRTFREARTHHLHLPYIQRGTNPSRTAVGHSERHERIT